MSSPTSEPNPHPPLPRRLVEAWRAAGPSAPELQRSYARFLRRRAARRLPLSFARWLAGGVLLGAGLAHAATSLPWRAWTALEHDAPPSRRPDVPTEQPRPKSSTPARASAEVTIAEEATPSPETVEAARPRGNQAQPAQGPTSASAAMFRVQEEWRRAAEGLRTHDFALAEGALLELEKTASSGEREAARLARAQLLLRHGRRQEALALAASLERSAASRVVRDKARELHLALSKNAEPGRSSEHAEGIKQP